MTLTHTTVGTPIQLAPEVFANKLVKKTDVYSFGCTLLEVMTGLRPWHGISQMSRLNQVVLCEGITAWDHYKKNKVRGLTLGQTAENVCEVCLKFAQDKRPSIDEILKMEFFNQD